MFLHPETKEEYALARRERKTGTGHKAFSFEFDKNVSLEEDLGRRDITINAIAQDEQGNLIDPYQGQQDIKDKKIRRVSDAFKAVSYTHLRAHETLRYRVSRIMR